MDKCFTPNKTHDFKAIKSAAKDRINDLRALSGLALHDFKTRKLNGETILTNPGKMNVTSYDAGTEFARINLNGGDSGGYYYPLKSPVIVYNFKGEPNLSLKDINPDFYRTAKNNADKLVRNEKIEDEKSSTLERHELAKQNSERFYIGFRDEKTDVYYVGYHDFSNGKNNFSVVSSKDKIKDYLLQHGTCESPEFIETWNYEFDPSNLDKFDYPGRFANLFEPSEYLINASKLIGGSIPPNIDALIQHALGPDKAMFDHFINWLAYIFQYRTQSQTAWVLQGVSGTGKGILYNQIVRPLFGDKQCLKLNIENFEELFNKSVETSIFMLIDEVDTDQIKNSDRVIAKLKTSITEPTLGVRGMRENYREASNHINIMMASNRHNSMRIEDGDRRFNICQRQEQSLKNINQNIPALLTSINGELQCFADYLYSYPVDLDKVRTPLENSAKKLLASTTQTSIETVAIALNQGDLEFFMAHRPVAAHSIHCTFDGNQFFGLTDNYYIFLSNAIRIASLGQSQVLQHAELFAIFETLVGKVPATKIKLKSWLSHPGIHVVPLTFNNQSLRGYKTKWSAKQNELVQWQQDLLVEKESNKPKSVEQSTHERMEDMKRANAKH